MYIWSEIRFLEERERNYVDCVVEKYSDYSIKDSQKCDFNIRTTINKNTFQSDI